MEKDIELSEGVEYVESICFDKSITLNDGTATGTITTADGQSLPVTFIVSQPFDEDGNYEGSVIEEADSEGCQIISEDDVGVLKDEKDDTQTVYTVSLSDIKQEDLSCISIQEGEVINEIKSKQDIPEGKVSAVQQVSDTKRPLERLEDFMDVVTTYKCKFCRFSCPWKSGLMSHIRCCHKPMTFKLEKDNENALSDQKGKSERHSISPEPDDVLEEVEERYDEFLEENSKESDIDNSCSIVEPVSNDVSNSSNEFHVLERHIFLCGQCSDGFVSLEDCKQHMVEEHNLSMSKDKIQSIRKRGRPKSKIVKVEKVKKKKRVKKEVVPKVVKKHRNQLLNLHEDIDFTIKRKLQTGCVNDRAFRCSKNLCGHRFTTQANAQYHAETHTSNVDKPFTCQECQEDFVHWRVLALHLWREHTIDVDLYSCSQCSYKAFSFFKLDNHSKIHSEERAFMCDTCGKSFKQITQLRNHVVIHLDRKNLPEKRWYSEQECTTCGRKFSDTKCLRKHEQAVHSKLKPYICTFCGHQSARKAMLELHMRHHTGEKPFLCDHCDYRTGDHNSLRRHRMRHTGDKPYKCPHCPYACIQAISYKTHLRNKHPGMEGIFSCTLCTFKTVSKEKFIHHVSDHKRLSEVNIEEATANIPPAVETDPDEPSAVQMQLTDNALQQLEGILPSNITAAQLIYSCLNAMSQEGGPVTLPPGVTLNIPPDVTQASDGTQTITIQVPSGEDLESEPYYFTIQQQDGTTALLVPSADKEDLSIQLTEQDINSEVSLQLPDVDEREQLQQENSDMVIAHIETITDPTHYLATSEVQSPCS